jgi:hypothetical protein
MPINHGKIKIYTSRNVGGKASRKEATLKA